jgi:hypothetical protein
MKTETTSNMKTTAIQVTQKHNDHDIEEGDPFGPDEFDEDTDLEEGDPFGPDEFDEDTDREEGEPCGPEGDDEA